VLFFGHTLSGWSSRSCSADASRFSQGPEALLGLLVGFLAMLIVLLVVMLQGFLQHTSEVVWTVEHSGGQRVRDLPASLRSDPGNLRAQVPLISRVTESPASSSNRCTSRRDARRSGRRGERRSHPPQHALGSVVFVFDASMLRAMTRNL